MIDDEEAYLDVMKICLRHDFEVITFTDPTAAFSAFRTKAPDAVILDVHLGTTDGFSVFKELRELKPELPIFFLSCNTAAEMIGKGLLTGGTDYLTKNTSTAEIISRIRSRLQTMKGPTVLRCREIEMNTESCEVRVSRELLNLTPKEYDILKVFMERQDEILSKADLLDLLWQGVTVDANNIDTHMFHIRKKFRTLPAIECRKGRGYILRSKPQ